MRHRRAAAALALAAAAGLAHGDEARLEIKLTGIRHASGTLRVSVYRDAASFRKEDRAVVLADTAAAIGLRSIQVAGLAPGRYAVMAYHDENGDGRLNRLFGMIPTEGWGLSNNPQVTGPPAFADSAFDVYPGENAQIIELHY